MIIVLCIYCVSATTQDEVDSVEQGFYVAQDDPTYRSSTPGFHFMLPHTDLSYYNSSFTPEDVVVSSEGKNLITLKEVQNQLLDRNTVLFQSSLRTIGMKWHNERISIGLGHQGRWLGSLQYTDDLASLVTYGNASLLGNPAGIGTDQDYIYYNEYHLSAALDIGGWVIGGRIKFLSGQEFIETPSRDISINTMDGGYTIEFDNDYQINTYKVLNYQGLNDVDLSIEPWGLSAPFGNNSGFAFDFGVRGSIGDHLQIHTSVSDMGGITWDEATIYTSTETLFYEGIDLLDYLSEDGNVDIADSLYNLLELKESTTQNLSSGIPQIWKLGVTGKFGTSHQLGSEYSILKHNRLSLHSLKVFWMYDLGSDWNTMFHYTIAGNTYDNIGAAIMKRRGLFQWHFKIDNLMGLVKPLDVKYGSFSVGGSLFFD
ncbi:MAG: hypothetical protein HKN68_17535 [Saprospiraceae bacterium]|nr:hypothetical protein [Saprospiraceae bacterium]